MTWAIGDIVTIQRAGVVTGIINGRPRIRVINDKQRPARDTRSA